MAVTAVKHSHRHYTGACSGTVQALHAPLRTFVALLPPIGPEPGLVPDPGPRHPHARLHPASVADRAVSLVGYALDTFQICMGQ